MLSDNLKTVRKNRGYSQEELAEKIHVSRQTVSKWESGRSVPDAEIIKSVAEVLGVSISELIEGDAQRVLENEVIIDRLSGINEQLIILNRKAKRRSRITLGICLALCLLLALGAGLFIIRQQREKGYRITEREHLGVLTYSLPEGFYHVRNDVGVRAEVDGKFRITAKSYRNYSDMTQITLWELGDYSIEAVNAFKKDYPFPEEDPACDLNFLPPQTEYFSFTTDAGIGEDGIARAGSYCLAMISLNGRLYAIKSVNSGLADDYAEFVISSMTIDTAKPQEYWIP